MAKDQPTNGTRERVDAHERRINDHEKRMRILEQARARWGGMVVAASVIIAAISSTAALAISLLRGTQ